MYKTIIVEDDLMVCSILEKQLGKFAQLRLEGNSLCTSWYLSTSF